MYAYFALLSVCIGVCVGLVTLRRDELPRTPLGVILAMVGMALLGMGILFLFQPPAGFIRFMTAP